MHLMEKEQPKSLISQDTLMPLSMIATMCAAAISFGIMYQKVEFSSQQISDLKVQVTALNDKFDRIILDNKSLTKR